ncbi:N(2)-fixation sustaining protein CowN [Komagataeibacter sp. FNDCR2]|uniref:N(2)-fixation sustaining protein CowN n=1 Tax=Komagataeibacter sp. FNDCR2 TaxID=2878682 RepID=UPI001E534A8A|nr:N(2)-fixation sustaining protein CowN [Komagataeibacter sp. FNDCR2]MCE2574314.1 N(2)-fixation sustaining protein CowN [Komagataeibacter sp. FNDCR2]
MSEQIDRYVSFRNVEWERRTAEVFGLLQPHFDTKTSPFWEYFLKQRVIAHYQGLDDLRVLHNFLPTLKDILEDLDDDAALSKLEELEVLCM